MGLRRSLQGGEKSRHLVTKSSPCHTGGSKEAIPADPPSQQGRSFKFLRGGGVSGGGASFSEPEAAFGFGSKQSARPGGASWGDSF